jgi:hypothetical protein
VIRDIVELRRTGVASRLVAELDIPASTWRSAMCHAGRRDGARVRTFLIPPAVVDAHSSRHQLVFAVRTNPPPDPVVQRHGLLRWWRVDELTMPFERWRAALHRVARRDHVRVHTFLVPPPSADRDGRPDQLVYVVWADTTDTADTREPPGAPSATALQHPRHDPLPVTSLTAYRAAHSSRAASIARHPSSYHGDEVESEDVDR